MPSAVRAAEKPSAAPKVEEPDPSSVPKNAPATPALRESPVPKVAVTSPGPSSSKRSAAAAPASSTTSPMPKSESPADDAPAAIEAAEAAEPTEEDPAPAGPASPDSPSVESSTLEALLENIDIEDPTDADLALLEAALNAGTATVERATDRRAAFGAERKQTSKPAPPVVPATAPSEPPPLRLEGISVADGKPVAVINGARVFEGDSVEGARVVRIVQDSVVLDFGGRTITLRF